MIDAKADLVSILMPTLNAEEFIERALQSIVEQELPDVEVVISDGGSTDATLDVISRFNPALKIRVLPRRDNGQSDGLNRALRAARGEILGWMNANDEYAPKSLPNLLARLKTDPRVLMAYGHYEHIDESGARLSWHAALPPWAWVHRHEGFVTNAQSMLWRRELQNRIGVFDETLHRTMDYDLIMRLLDATRTREAVRVDITVGRFRRHEGQKTAPSSDGRVLSEHLRIQANAGRSSARHRRLLLPFWLAGRAVRLGAVLRHEGVLRAWTVLRGGPRLLPERSDKSGPESL